MLFKAPLLSLLALTAVALPLDEYRRALDGVTGRALSVSEQDVNNFRLYVQYAGAAYCNAGNSPGSPISCSDNACPTAQSNGATTIASFGGLTTGIEGLVIRDDAARAIIFTVRGSSNIRNWIANIQFAFSNCNNLVHGCQAHTGFFNAWNEMRSAAITAINNARAANPDYAVVATGHSLGGAVATLGAAYMRAHEGIPVQIYSFGSPRVGNGDFANFVTSQSGVNFRLTHGADPVSRLPPIIFGYRHTSPEYWLNGRGSDHTGYGPGDIRVCQGTATLSCNGGTLGLDITAHLHFFQDVSACNPKSFGRQEISDEELEERVNEWVRQDLEYVQEHPNK